MSILGIIFIILGIFVIFTNPELRRPRFKFTGLRIRGLAGPILIILGALMLAGVIPG